MAFAESRLRDDDNTVTRTLDLVRWGAVVAAAIISHSWSVSCWQGQAASSVAGSAGRW
jgi:hypothetical protein